MKKLVILLALTLVACSEPKEYWGTVTEVDKDKRLLRSSLWHYTVAMDDGSIRTGRLKVIVKKGWRMCFDSHGRILKIEQNQEKK